MKTSKITLAIISLIMSAYFWFMRFDIVTRIFEKGVDNADIGQLILPAILLTLGLVLIFWKPQKGGTDEK